MTRSSWAVVAGAAAACGAPATSDTAEECTDTGGGLAPLAPCPEHNADYRLTGVKVRRDLLLADLTYGGGCCDHEFALCWDDQGFRPGDVARLSIAFDDHHDPCDLGYVASRKFPLRPLQQAWLDQGGEPSATIHLEIDGFRVDYTFGLVERAGARHADGGGPR